MILYLIKKKEKKYVEKKIILKNITSTLQVTIFLRYICYYSEPTSNPRLFKPFKMFFTFLVLFFVKIFFRIITFFGGEDWRRRIT